MNRPQPACDAPPRDPATRAADPAPMVLPIRQDPSPDRALRVLFYTAPGAMQDPGGGEVQLIKTAEHLVGLGVEAKLFDPWTDRMDHADWMHLFGTLGECLTMARLARRLGVRVALSPISWYDPGVSWRLEPAWARKLRGVAGWSARSLFRRLPSWRRELIRSCDLLLPNSQAEARQLERLLDADPRRTVVVPNGVDGRFETADPALFEARFGVRNFVLVPGRVEPRKNQLSVIRALWGTGLTLLILGDAHLEHRAYYEQCRREADPGVLFVPRLDHGSALLASAYAAARVVVLASWFETPGLAALEGALAGAAVVVTARGSAREYFGPAARYIDPGDIGGIRQQVRHAFAGGGTPGLPGLVREQFLWDEVARQTLDAYRSAGSWRDEASASRPAAA